MNKTQVSIDTLNRTLPAVSSVNFPKILEENVGNFCPACGKTIFSNLLEIDGKAYLEKNCCTKELVLMDNDVEFFKKCKNYTEVEPAVLNPKSIRQWHTENPNYGTSTFTLHVTMRCNQNCPVCYRRWNNCHEQHFEPSLEEIKEGLRKYKSRDIHLLGGEPTVREDLFEIIKAIKDSGNIPGIYTNGLKLENKNYTKELKKAGLNYISLQFDGFNREANIRLRGRDNLDKQLKILENIKEVGGLRVALVPIIEKGLNETELSKIIQFAQKNEFIDKITIMGLTPPPGESITKTTFSSDLMKIMEKEGYLDQEYFLELMKMYCDIYKITRKIIKGTPLENWVFKRLSSVFNIIHFKKGTNPPKVLFQKEKIEKINEILTEAMNEKNRIASFGALLKNSRDLINSPLTALFKEKFFILKKKGAHSNSLLEIGFQKLIGPKNTLLKNPRGIGVFFVANLPALAQFTTET